MLLNVDEKIIIARIIEGDSEAENYVFTHFRERIQFLVRVRSRGNIPAQDQQDIISEINQAILLSLRKGGFDPGREKPLEAYIAGIAGNIVGQYFRKLKREKINIDIDLQHHIENPGNILTDLIDEERVKKLKDYLQRLNQKYKEVLVLRVYENKSIEEIAKQLNIDRRRVSERINYAFKLLLKECKKDNYFQ